MVVNQELKDAQQKVKQAQKQVEKAKKNLKKKVSAKVNQQTTLAIIKNDLIIVSIIFVIAHYIKEKLILKSNNLFNQAFIKDLVGTLIGFSVFNAIENMLPKLPHWFPVSAIKVGTMIVVKTVVLAIYDKQDVVSKFTESYVINLALVVASMILYDLFVKNILNKNGTYSKVRKIAPVVDEVSGKAWEMVISDVMGDGDIEKDTPLNVLTTLGGIVGFHLINSFVTLV